MRWRKHEDFEQTWFLENDNHGVVACVAYNTGDWAAGEGAIVGTWYGWYSVPGGESKDVRPGGFLTREEAQRGVEEALGYAPAPEGDSLFERGMDELKGRS